jgi:CheY-like chemotaxis protein
VADTGEGISAEVLPYVFDRFRQEDSSSSRAHGGLGLGLALVRHFVELHGGRVSAESPGKGQGATFRVTLPSALPRKADLSARTLPEQISSARSTLLLGLRVLVVDDDADALDLTATTLRREGAEVRVSSSAFRAHEIATEWQPHILVSDLAMPGEDGFMLLRAMRHAIAKSGRKLAAIAVTAYGTAENEMRSFEAGYDLYLTKPFDPLEFAAAIAGVAHRVR